MDACGMFTLLGRLRPLAFFALLFWFSRFNAAFGGILEGPGTPKKTVLVLYGERLSIPAMRLTEEGLSAALSSASTGDLEIFSEYLDLTRFPATRYGDDIVRYLRVKYGTRKPDVLIALVSTTLQFVLEHRDELFPGVPIVFGNIDYREIEGKEMPPNVTGLWMAWDYQRTLELALQLQPNTREVVCVAGTGLEEQPWNNEARKVLERFATRVRTRWLDKLPLQAVLDEVARLPLDSVVLYIPMLRDGSGQSVSPFDVSRQLADASRVPVYGLSRPELENGLIGGALLDFSKIGGKIAALALRVLAGEKLSVLSSPDPATNPLLINWQALKKWQVSESRIPGEATVLYGEASLWEQHPRLILATAAALILQSLLIVGLVIQRSRRMRAEGSLRESEERMSLAAESANLGMLAWDIPRDDIWATEKCRSLHGFEPGERVDFQKFIDRLHPEDREPTREAVLRSMKARGEFDAQYRLLLPDAGVRWISTRGHATFDSHNRAVRLLGASIDITAPELAKFQVQELRDELAHLSRVTTLGEMATTLAHELNQPLGAIQSNAEAAEIFLQKNPPDFNELRAILGDIRQDGLRAAAVIRRMRALLRRQAFKMDRIEIKGVLEALAGLLQGTMISRKARLRIDVAPALPPVWGDAVQLQQVLLNLVVNALDAMIDCPAEEREVVIRAMSHAMQGVEICVTDRGPGFTEETLTRLFEPFFTTKKHGMGVGLRICQRIIEAHDGQLTAENNPDRGARVRFTLPRSRHEKENSE
jgi:C4-dicarboxylate-specific signal transduction histidine kinase/ABC-type uncharacterized transport system substrate-binding protein